MKNKKWWNWKPQTYKGVVLTFIATWVFLTAAYYLFGVLMPSFAPIALWQSALLWGFLLSLILALVQAYQVKKSIK